MFVDSYPTTATGKIRRVELRAQAGDRRCPVRVAIMLDGHRLIDVHLHPAKLSGLKLPWDTWVQSFDSPQLRAIYDADGVVDPAAFDALPRRRKASTSAVVLAEYSPKVTGTQAVEDFLPLTRAQPGADQASPRTSTRTCTSRSTRNWCASSTSARSR